MERSVRQLSQTASRLKEEAVGAARRARQAETLFRKRNVAAEYARAAALAAEMERAKTLAAEQETNWGHASRVRMFKERERRDQLVKLANAPTKKLMTSFSQSRIPDSGGAMIGIPSKEHAPFW